VTLIPTTRQFFTTLAKTSAPPLSQYFRDLLSDDPARVQRADREISKDPLLHALSHNTVAPVTTNAGFRSNVIPGSAEATINLRLIPGSDANEIVKEFQRVVADTRVQVRLGAAGARGGRGVDSAAGVVGGARAGGGRAAVPPSSEQTELFQALVRAAGAEWPGAEVTPYLFQAGTDAGAWRSRGVPVYGIYPYPIDADELTRMHGNDERVSVESLRQGTEMIFKTLVDVAGKR